MSFIHLDDYQLYFEYKKNSNNPEEPVLILLHDSWGCVEMWEDFPNRLSELFRLNVLVYDRQGYGKSSPFSPVERTKYYLHNEADILIRIMDARNIKKAILYGHSDGATIALIAAGTYPERFSAIMVEGAHSFVEEKGRNAVRESREKAKHNSLLKSLERFHGNKTEELFRRWHAAWLGDFFDDWSIVPLLRQIKCPTLAFRGENDPYDTEEQIYVLEREITNTPISTRIIANAAHVPRKENWEETMRLIEKFKNSLTK